MEFIKLIWIFITRNPFLAIPMAIGLIYGIAIALDLIDCETRARIAVNPSSVQCGQ
ncbi:hypothetical protein [Cupriavidus sp. IK-TO18]|jgi:hypothetical protein|uniref:hypothetical protein n=1 Tax=Cupriavidus sp. IK-TO18 TaxID=2782182 RepID=UPI001897D0BE|nr:hypothetical protein [Cupriavidus sp. IK-TO18]MBF6989305.1 hypothetical protein [Cupriavidus sp. IK-TO18]